MLGVGGGECLWGLLGRLVGVSGLESGLWIWVLCPLSAGFWAVKAGRFDLALRVVGGVWSACWVWWGRGGWKIYRRRSIDAMGERELKTSELPIA